MGQKLRQHRNGLASRLYFPCIVLGSALIGAAAGYLAGPGKSSSYLNLQRSSDTSHLVAVVALPACLTVSFLAWSISRLGRRLAGWIPWICRATAVFCLGLATGVLVFVVQFDHTIEKQGLAGQLVLGLAPSTSLGRFLPVLGPFSEDLGNPGVAILEIEGGDLLISDSRRLARKKSDGKFRWTRTRPGRIPGSIMLAGQLVLFLGPGPDYPDDVVVVAVELASGKMLWRFHCLGQTIHTAPVLNGELFFVAQRPTVSSVSMLRLAVPEKIWTVLLDGSVHLPPRSKPDADGIEVAVDSKVVLLHRPSGQVLSTTEACREPEQLGVVCSRGKVIAWNRGVGR